MSYKAIGWAYDMPIKGPQKPVLNALADMADEEASCFPGQQRIANMTGLSVATVRRALDKLEAQKLIVRERRSNSLGHRTSDRYRLQLDRVEPESLALTLPTRQPANKAESNSLALTVQLPTAHSERGTTSRTTRENNQSDTGSVSPVTNVTRAARSRSSDYEPDAIEFSKLARIRDLARVHRMLQKAVKDPLPPMAAVELVTVLTDRAAHPVEDVDAFIATACRQTPADVRRWYVECDLGGAA